MSSSPDPSANPAEATPSVTLTSDERTWAMLVHLAGPIATYVLGGMGFIGPLIVWLMKKESSRFVDEQGKESLNFQINLLVQGIVILVVGLVLTVVTFGLGICVLAPLLIAWALYATIMPIVAGISANSGTSYRYPATIRLIK